MKIKITLEEGESYDLYKLRFILLDALYEFQSARYGDYVERRYPEMSEEFKYEKRKSNQKRILMASKLHSAAWHMETVWEEEE